MRASHEATAGGEQVKYAAVATGITGARRRRRGRRRRRRRKKSNLACREWGRLGEVAESFAFASSSYSVLFACINYRSHYRRGRENDHHRHCECCVCNFHPEQVTNFYELKLQSTKDREKSSKIRLRHVWCDALPHLFSLIFFALSLPLLAFSSPPPSPPSLCFLFYKLICCAYCESH